MKLDAGLNVIRERVGVIQVDEVVNDVVAIPEGGVAVAGWIRDESGVYTDGFLAALDANLDTLWTPQTYGDYLHLYDQGINALTTVEDTAYVAVGFLGNQETRGITRPAAARLDEFGDYHPWWVNEALLPVELNDVIQSPPSYFVGAGRVGNEVCAVQLNSSGEEMWAHKYDGIYARAHGICPGAGGEYVLAGTTEDGRTFLLFVDDNGDEVSLQIYSDRRDMGVNAVLRTPQGGPLFVGYAKVISGIIPRVPPIPGYNRQALVEPEGQLFGGGGAEEANDDCLAVNDGYLLAGWTTSYGGRKDVYVVELPW